LGGPGCGAPRRARQELADRFFDALRKGDVEGLRELLAADAQVMADSGGKAPLFGKGIFGAENAVRFLVALWPQFMRIGGTVEPHEINGQPGAIFRDRDGKVMNTWSIEVLDGRIQAVRAVLNPDKLQHVGPVADQWAVVREAMEGRRSGDA
jgi:RNA polymerase sigma-70 factor (ECF subfamily)